MDPRLFWLSVGVTVFLLLTAIYWLYRWASWLDAQHTADQIGRPLYGILLVAALFGILVGSCPIIYPFLAKGWGMIGLNINELRPLSAPKLGKHFTYDTKTHTLTLKEIPESYLMVVKIPGGNPKGELIPTGEKTYPILEHIEDEAEKSAAERKVEVYFQNQDDGRTSSGVRIVTN